MSQKKELRQRYLQKRKALNSQTCEDLSIEIANQALQLDIWGSTYYHLFLSIAEKNEVNTEYLLHILQGKDKSIVVPKSDFKTKRLTHILLQENTSIEISSYGIPEPREGLEVPANQLDVVFVPLLAFDLNGNRIGYGGGFYDRFLSECRTNCLKIGLSFFDPEENILPENIDFPLDLCVTPKKIYSF